MILLFAPIIALLAAIIIYLVRMWISDIAILLGLESNAELERARAIDSGHPPGENPYVEPRGARKLWHPGWCAGRRDVGTRLPPRIRRTDGRGPSAGHCRLRGEAGDGGLAASFSPVARRRRQR